MKTFRLRTSTGEHYFVESESLENALESLDKIVDIERKNMDDVKHPDFDIESYLEDIRISEVSEIDGNILLPNTDYVSMANEFLSRISTGDSLSVLKIKFDVLPDEIAFNLVRHNFMKLGINEFDVLYAKHYPSSDFSVARGSIEYFTKEFAAKIFNKGILSLTK